MTTIANLTSKRTTSTAGNNDSLTHTATQRAAVLSGFKRSSARLLRMQVIRIGRIQVLVCRQITWSQFMPIQQWKALSLPCMQWLAAARRCIWNMRRMPQARRQAAGVRCLLASMYKDFQISRLLQMPARFLLALQPLSRLRLRKVSVEIFWSFCSLRVRG